MRTIWTGVSTAIVGFATVVGAQTSSAPQRPAPATESQITVTGCLKQGVMTVGTSGTAGVAGTAGTAGTTGTTGTATTGDSNEAALLFTLVNATSAPADATSTTDAASTTGTASTTGAATATSGSSSQTYRLIANPSALSPLVGKKLALTGVLDPQDNAALSTDPAAGSDAHAPVLRVKSGKIVAASCQ
jgi:hypothetical protein